MKRFLTFLFVICIAIPAWAGEKTAENLPKLLGHASQGTEFFLTFLPLDYDGEFNRSVKLIMVSESSHLVKIEVPGIDYEIEIMTRGLRNVEYELKPNIAMPYCKAPNDAPLLEQVFAGRAIHVTSPAPILLYAMVQYGDMEEGYLVSPVHRLGRKYAVFSYPDTYGDGSAGDGARYSSYSACVGAYSETNVTFSMAGTEVSKTVGGLLPGQSTDFDLGPCDVVLIGSDGNQADLTGSVWSADKPIAVVSGNYYTAVPNTISQGNHLIEMEIPMEYWGTEYPVSTIWNREKPSVLRVIGSEDNTQVFRDGNPIAILKSANGAKGEGWLEMRASDIQEAPVPVVISADKPIAVTQYNTLKLDDQSEGASPFQMALLPTNMYVKEMNFIVPEVDKGYEYDNHYINLIYRSENNTIPDDIMIAEFEKYQLEWSKLSDRLTDKGKEFGVDIFGNKYYSATLRLEKKQMYKIKADYPFMVYSYGNRGDYAYGFPSCFGADSRLFADDNMPPLPEWTQECDGTIENGTVKDMPEDGASCSGMGLVYISDYSIINYAMEIDEYSYGETGEISWRLDVINKFERATAHLVFEDMKGNDTTILITYDPLEYKAREMNGMKVKLGEVRKTSFILANLSHEQEIVINDIFIKDGQQHFTLGEIELPFVLAVYDSVLIPVDFDAGELGEFIDSIGIEDECKRSLALELRAIVECEIIEATDLDCDTVGIGSTLKYEATIKNNGHYSLEIYGYEGIFGHEGVFDVGLPDISEEMPLIISAGAQYNIPISFSPLAETTYIDSVKFLCNVYNGPGVEQDSVIVLRGVGSKTVSVKELSKNIQKIKISPEIVKSGAEAALTFNAPESGLADIAIYDANGRRLTSLKQMRCNPGSVSTDLLIPDMAPGLYFIFVNIGGNVQSVRFVVN